MKHSNITTNKTTKIAIWAMTGLAILIGAVLINQQTSIAADAIIYKSPTCGCCSDWIKHLEEHGFTTEVHNNPDMSPVKNDLGVPLKLQSCHTAKIGGYVIEGHVPADVIARLLKEKPSIKGLAVPGMPMGSPGMEGPHKDPYDVVTFDDNGKTSVYARR